MFIDIMILVKNKPIFNCYFFSEIRLKMQLLDKIDKKKGYISECYLLFLF